ncbi:MAG: hypothetical protein GY938_30620 [Ketobacter sp.]|nr:hypothetical protein [Ketobacter sp.]
MNHKELNRTLGKANRELRAELRRVTADLKYIQALFKLSEKKVEETK